MSYHFGDRGGNLHLQRRWLLGFGGMPGHSGQPPDSCPKTERKSPPAGDIGGAHHGQPPAGPVSAGQRPWGLPGR